MKTTVIITTYNRTDSLVKVAEALKHQTEPADEIIIADDGSGQETLDTVHKLMADFPQPLYHVWHEDLGFRAAEIRNKAIHKSTGKYIILLDGDCIPDKYFVEDHRVMAEKGFFFQGKRILISRRLSQSFTHENANSKTKLVKYIFSQDISNSHHLLRLPFFPACSSAKTTGTRSCNMGFFREDIFAVNGFNQDFVGWGREDSELVVRFFKYGLKRKQHPFMAVCFHLWHLENNREQLVKNDMILKNTAESNEYICTNGLLGMKP